MLGNVKWKGKLGCCADLSVICVEVVTVWGMGRVRRLRARAARSFTSWWACRAVWGPRTAWRCSWWTPSPCTPPRRLESSGPRLQAKGFQHLYYIFTCKQETTKIINRWLPIIITILDSVRNETEADYEKNILKVNTAVVKQRSIFFLSCTNNKSNMCYSLVNMHEPPLMYTNH